MDASRLNFERVEQPRWLAIIGTMFRRRVRTLLIASFPAVVAAALCIVGDLFEASAFENGPLAEASNHRGEPEHQEDTEYGTEPVTPVGLDLETLRWNSPLARATWTSLPSARLDRRAATAIMGSELDPLRDHQFVFETDCLATSLAVVAPPIRPHAPPIPS